MHVRTALSLAVSVLVVGCSREDKTTGPTSSTPSTAVASASASTPVASAAAPALPDVDLEALRAKYCAKPGAQACTLLDEFAKASPFDDTGNEDIYFGWGYELDGGGKPDKSMTLLRTHSSEERRFAKGGVYVPADDKARKTTSDLVETLRGGGKAAGEAKGFFLFLRGNPGPDPWRVLSKTQGPSTAFAGAAKFMTWLRRDTAAKGRRLLTVTWAGGEVIEGPHPCELRVAELWELHTEK